MKHIVLFSGGIASFMAAKRVVETHGKDNTILLFTDTRAEDEDLHRFIIDAVAHLKCEYLKIEDGRNIWQVFNDVKFMGNNRIDPCSRILKRDLFKKWLKANYQPDQCTLHYGINWDEIHRLDTLQKRWQPYNVSAPLCEKPYIDKLQMFEYLDTIGIKPPRLYGMGFMHNNCGGFCVKSGQAQFKMLLEKMPARYQYHEDQQERLFSNLGKRNGFIRMQTLGELRYLGLKEFREILESKEQIDELDFGGCACFA